MQIFHLLFVIFNIKSIFSLINFDLTYTIRSTNPIFPGLTPFNFTQTFTSWGSDDSNEYYFKALNTFITGEHFGTHIDAPYHGSNTSWTIEQIPFERLVSIQALIVDVSKKSSIVKNYPIQIEDLNEDVMKQANGFYVLLFYTGKSKFWPNQDAYAGGHIREELDFPGLSAQLASYLVNKYSEKLVGVGIDTLSIDPGSSKHFHAHRILFKKNIYVLENVATLNRVLKYLSNRRETFFTFDVLPMKIEGGTGAPCRLVARLENFDNISGGWFGFLIFCLLLMIIGVATKVIYDFKYNPDKNFA
ncbi:unnamed protein product [Rotaria sp. Silwood2]|nr:unnamed protein product [Rotaria sp. Silwood2]CAF2613498.1 unnamed protein product [Rotaria sp. Silwood2]CAF2874830.1 unnamed protein product [Rotaria sp. Silwood2]CAF3026841.1 unnamed protein product [Rotaria sp. Silwood2]CAF3861234.1 unnamed protein product [Rotaria sp. Silwood2]